MTYAESQLEPRQIDKVDRLKSVIESVDFVDVSTGKGASHGKACHGRHRVPGMDAMTEAFRPPAPPPPPETDLLARISHARVIDFFNRWGAGKNSRTSSPETDLLGRFLRAQVSGGGVPNLTIKFSY